MKHAISLPHRFLWFGLIILLPFLALGLLHLYHDFEIGWLSFHPNSKGLFNGNQNLTDEFALTGCIIGLLCMSFSSTKNEDEFIHSLRLQAWQWAVLINFLLLLAAIWLVYDTHFLTFMVYNMLTVLVIFLLRFQYLLYRYRSSAND